VSYYSYPSDALADVAAERRRQDAKWGPQNHPDGTGAHFHWIGKAFADHASADKQTRDVYREWARFRCQEFAKAGHVTWENILTEEWAEAMAEEDPAALRAELVQVAAVAVAWIEAIDRRAAATPTTETGADQ
jgi:hypothetical protein